MVMRNLKVKFKDSVFDLEVDVDGGFEVFQYQVYSITSVPPENQKVVGSSNKAIVTDVEFSHLVLSDSPEVTVLGQEEGNSAPEIAAKPDSPPPVSGPSPSFAVESDEELARRLQDEEDAALAVMMQEEESRQQPQRGAGSFQGQLEDYMSRVLQYENPAYQEKARGLIPIDEIQERAAIALWQDGMGEEEGPMFRDALMRQLLIWFKKWFKWVDSLPCDRCGGKTQPVGNASPTLHDLQFGGHRVEVHRCPTCGTSQRFVRYNDPGKLLETRQGRCGEWANCFTLCCRALGYEARLVVDWTDHVWTEFYSPNLKRWTHVDPCETAFDKPLLYEAGWGKKLNYCISFGHLGVRDTTWRYTRKWAEVRTRRQYVPETALASMILDITRRVRAPFSAQRRYELEAMDASETRELELAHSAHRSGTEPEEALPGRTTGSEEWRTNRGEMGESPATGTSQPMPPQRSTRNERSANDENVRAIYLSIANLCLSESGAHPPLRGPLLLPLKERASKKLGVIREVLEKLKLSPYKKRELVVFSGTGAVDQKWSELLERGKGLEVFEAAGFKAERRGEDGVLMLRSGGGEAAAGLLAAVEILDRVVGSSTGGQVLGGGGAWERVGGGRVSASGGNLPGETVLRLFDGLSSSKWVDFAGNKGGSWVQYRLKSPANVVGYEIVSADDCPERDPRSWRVEGSSDGGATWHVLDERNQQLFDGRHVIRTFELPPGTARVCDTVRFTFKELRDMATASCIQISCIDIYIQRTPQPTRPVVPKADVATSGPSSKNAGTLDTQTSAEQAQFAEALRTEFSKLMAAGSLSPNEAAAKALQNVKASLQKSE